MAQQRQILTGSKPNQSVRDLWMLSQTQLMCGQLPTVCKKYNVKLNRLDNVFLRSNSKANYQPKYDENHYLKYRCDHYDPTEFQITNSEYVDDGNYDPYGHYDSDDTVDFDEDGQIPRDIFLASWKSMTTEMEIKEYIQKTNGNDIERLKSLLNNHKIYFVHHRNIPNKGDILYCGCKLQGEKILIEISLALSGRVTICIRSNDKHKSQLTVDCVRSVIDSKM